MDSPEISEYQKGKIQKISINDLKAPSNNEILGNIPSAEISRINLLPDHIKEIQNILLSIRNASNYQDKLTACDNPQQINPITRQHIIWNIARHGFLPTDIAIICNKYPSKINDSTDEEEMTQLLDEISNANSTVRGIVAALSTQDITNRENLTIKNLTALFQSYPTYEQYAGMREDFIKKITPISKKLKYQVGINQLGRMLYGARYELVILDDEARRRFPIDYADREKQENAFKQKPEENTQPVRVLERPNFKKK